MEVEGVTLVDWLIFLRADILAKQSEPDLRAGT